MSTENARRPAAHHPEEIESVLSIDLDREASYSLRNREREGAALRPGSLLGSRVRIAFQETVAPLWRSLRYVWDASPRLFVLRIVIIVAEAVLPLLALYLLKLLLDTVTTGASDPGGMEAWLNMLIGAAAFTALLAVGVRWLGDYVRGIQNSVISDFMQGVLQRQLIAVDLAFFENPEDHDTMHRAMSQGQARPVAIFNSVAQLAQSLLSLGVISLVVISFSPLIGVVVALSSLPAGYVQLRQGQAMHTWQRESTALNRLSTYLHSLLVWSTAAKEIRVFRIGDLLRERFAALRAQLLSAQQSLLARRALASGASQGLATCAMFACYAYVAQAALHGRMTVGDLVLYYELFRRAQEAMRGSLNGLVQLNEDNLYVTHLFEFLDLEPTVRSPERPARVPKSIGEGIRFKGVSFRYPQTDTWALRDIDLTVGPGQHVALVGENGSGKTTLIKLVARLYDPSAGIITLDGTDIRDFEVASYRSLLGILFQDPARYHLTAHENIRMVPREEEHNRALLHRAASEAGISELIEGLPSQFETILGRWFRGGVELSIGEWQKIGLARALAADPQIVILDEPTSAFDPMAEHSMIERFRKVIAGRAALTISHRMSTIRWADTIHVMAGGRIVESGTHEELMKRNGRYASMFRAQLRNYL
jgi:ATP-binding cassette subfamily B protein